MIKALKRARFYIENPPILHEAMKKDIVSINVGTNIVELKKLFVKKNTPYALVKEGAEINKTDRWGQTPLNYCKSKHINAFLLHNSALKGE